MSWQNPSCYKKDRGYLLAVLPASQQLEWQALRRWLDQNLALATEDEIAWLFPDCTPGAVPPFGEAYGIDTVFDDSISEQADIYFEGVASRSQRRVAATSAVYRPCLSVLTKPRFVTRLEPIQLS